MIISEIKPGDRVIQERWAGMPSLEFLGEFAGSVDRVTSKGRVSIRWDSGGKSAVNADYLRAE